MSAATVQPAVRKSPAVWQNRTFLIIWLGHTVSILGDGFHSVALGFWVLQAEVPPEVQGRVMGTMNSLVNVASPLAMMVAGVLGDRFDPVLISGACCITFAMMALGALAISPALRRYD